MNHRQRAIKFSTYLLPFFLNLGIIEFLIPIKYDIVLGNLPLLGGLISLAFLASTLVVLSIGDFADKVGVKRTIQIGALLSTIGAFMFAFTNNFWLMTLSIFIWSMGSTAVVVPAMSFILSKFPSNFRGTAYGIYYGMMDIIYGCAPLIAFILTISRGIKTAILSAAFASLMSFLAFLRLKKKRHESISKALEEVVIEDRFILKELTDLKKFNLCELSLFMNKFMFGYWFVTIMMGAALLFFHGARDLWSAALLAFAFMIPFPFVDMIYGKLCDKKKNRDALIHFGFLSTAALLFIFAFTTNFYMLLTLAALMTITFNAAWVGSDIQISEYLPKKKKAEFTGIFFFAEHLGFNLAPLFYGVLTVLGLQFPFFALGFSLLGSWAFYSVANKFLGP